jgi:hypothetical protein
MVMSELPEPRRPSRRPRTAPKLPQRVVKEKNKDKEKQAPEADKAARSPWRRFVLWGVIGVLAVAAVAEFRAQSAYNKTIATCNSALEKIQGKSAADLKKVTFDELKGRLPSNPVYTEESHSFAKSGVYTWTWQGVRRYKVRLFVNLKDGTVWDVASEP